MGLKGTFYALAAVIPLLTVTAGASSAGCLEQKVADYRLAFGIAGHTGSSLKWINDALSSAQSGETKNYIDFRLGIAKKEAGYNADAPFPIEGMIEEVYSGCIKQEGPKNAAKWMRMAMEKAISGEVLHDVLTYLRFAQEYAQESGTSIHEWDVMRIIEAQVQGIKEFGMKNAAKWVRKAADEVGGNQARALFYLRIANQYAREAGQPLSFPR